MTYLVVLGLYFAALFAVAFISRRRMGVPTLTLAAGGYLATMWTNSLTPVVANAGVVIVSPPLSSLIAITLTLLPALIVMVREPKRTHIQHGIIASVVFAALGTMITYGAFSNAVVLDEGSRQIVLELVKYQSVVITTAIVLSVLELLFYKRPRRDRHKSE